MTEEQGSSMEQARAQRERAEREYAEAISRRPETIAEAAKAVKLRNENGFGQAMVQAMQAIQRTAS